MKRNMINSIDNLELKLNRSGPKKIASIVKKLVKSKDDFINGK